MLKVLIGNSRQAKTFVWKLNASKRLDTLRFSSSTVQTEILKSESSLDSLFLEKYLDLINSKRIKKDEHQLNVAIRINSLYSKLINYEAKCEKNAKSNKNDLNWFLRSIFSSKKNKKVNDSVMLKPPPIKGIYLYGGVGCGKTMLMDMLFSLLPENKLKLRIHFNKFMLSIHEKIHHIKNSSENQVSGDEEPFEVLAKQLINEVHILFFDEFQVTDIADAMLMSRLFTALFEHGIILFCTSNRQPHDLYKNGLQRELFEPFIGILENYCDVICLDSPNDYRKLNNISSNRIYFHCDFEEHLVDDLVSKEISKQDNSTVVAGKINLLKLKQETIEILGRTVVLEKTYKRLLDTTFKFICQDARSAVDYLELCKLFDIIILRNLPMIDLKDPSALRRFIVFIDTVYDNKKKLVLSGKATCVQLLFDIKISNKTNYDRKQVNDLVPSNSAFEDEIFAIDRTISRLIEMQSESYSNACKAKI